MHILRVQPAVQTASVSLQCFICLFPAETKSCKNCFFLLWIKRPPVSLSLTVGEMEKTSGQQKNQSIYELLCLEDTESSGDDFVCIRLLDYTQ